MVKEVKMKRFKVTEINTVAYVYEVNAENEFEAEEKVLMNEAEHIPERDTHVDRVFEFEEIRPQKKQEVKMSETKPILELSEQDGNAFLIMGKAVKVARKAGWSQEKIDEYMEKAQSGDYDHLLQVTMEYFDVE